MPCNKNHKFKSINVLSLNSTWEILKSNKKATCVIWFYEKIFTLLTKTKTIFCHQIFCFKFMEKHNQKDITPTNSILYCVLFLKGKTVWNRKVNLFKNVLPFTLSIIVYKGKLNLKVTNYLIFSFHNVIWNVRVLLCLFFLKRISFLWYFKTIVSNIIFYFKSFLPNVFFFIYICVCVYMLKYTDLKLPKGNKLYNSKSQEELYIWLFVGYAHGEHFAYLWNEGKSIKRIKLTNYYWREKKERLCRCKKHSELCSFFYQTIKQLRFLKALCLPCIKIDLTLFLIRILCTFFKKLIGSTQHSVTMFILYII